MENNLEQNKIVFKPVNDNVEFEVRLDDETVWLTQKQMSILFKRDSDTIGDHIRSIFKEGE